MKKLLFALILYVIPSLIYAQTVIQMKKEGGVYTVPCKVNDLALRFIFDTGESNISISSIEALFMLKNGYLNSDDFIGKEKYRDATGKISIGSKIIIRKLEFSGLTLHNIEASVVNTLNAPLLLGQSVLSKLGKIQIDYLNNTLTIDNISEINSPLKTPYGEVKVKNMENEKSESQASEIFIDATHSLKFYNWIINHDLYSEYLNNPLNPRLIYILNEEKISAKHFVLIALIQNHSTYLNFELSSDVKICVEFNPHFQCFPYIENQVWAQILSIKNGEITELDYGYVYKTNPYFDSNHKKIEEVKLHNGSRLIIIDNFYVESFNIHRLQGDFFIDAPYDFVDK